MRTVSWAQEQASRVKQGKEAYESLETDDDDVLEEKSGSEAGTSAGEEGEE